MKKLSTLIFFLGAVSIVFSQNIENFDYTTGDQLIGKEGGTGFLDAWEEVKGSEQAVIGEGGITIAGLSLASSNNHLSIVHEGEGGPRLIRKLSTPVVDDGSTHYMSWIMDADYDDPASNGSVFQAMILISAGYGGSGPGGQTVRMGKIFSTERFGVDGARVIGGTKFIDGTDTREGYWAVAVINMSGDDENETISIFINPDVTNGLDTANADLQFEAQLNTGFDAIGAKLEGGAAINGQLDELRFGSALADVVPTDLEPVTPSVVASQEPFDYEIGDSLKGQVGGAGFANEWVFKKGDLQASILEGGIEVLDLNVRTANNKLGIIHNAGDGGARFSRKLEVPVSDDGERYYMSWIMDADYDDPESNGSVFQTMLIIDEGFGATGPGGQTVRMGKIFNTERLGVDGARVSGGTKFIDSTDTRDAYWAVAVIDMSGDEEEETISLFINPDVTGGLDTSEADLQFSAQLNTGFNAIGAKLEGGAGLIGSLDDLRFGPELDDVVPDDLTSLGSLDPAYDDFTYEVGDSLNGQMGGEGWLSAWDFKKGSSEISIGEGGVGIDALGVQSSTNHIQGEHLGGGEGARFIRPLATPVSDDGNVYWLSWIMDSDFEDAANNGSVFQTMILDSETFGAGGPGGQLVRMGKIFGTTEIGIDGSAAGGRADIAGSASNEPYWAVVRLEMSGDENSERMDFWINKDASNGLDTASSDLTINPTLNSGFDALGAKLEGGQDISGRMDELRFGPTLQSVIPNDLTPFNPGVAAAFDKFEYGLSSTLDSLSGGEGWSAEWDVKKGNSASGFVEGGAEIIDLQVKSSGNALEIIHSEGGEGFRAVRSLKAPVMDDGETYYMSWIMQADYDDPELNGSVFQAMILNQGFGASGPGGQMVRMGKFFNSENFGIDGQRVSSGGGTLPNTDTQEGYWAVVEIIMSGDDNDETLNIFINQDLSNGLDGLTPDATVFADLDSGFTGIGFKMEGAQALSGLADELRFGLELADVIPGDLEEVLPETVYEGFIYDVGEEVVGKDGGEGWADVWLGEGATSTVGDGSIANERTDVEGNKLTLSKTDDNVSVERIFKLPFGTAAGAYWSSVLIDIEEKGLGNAAGISYKSSVEEGSIFTFGGVQGLGDFAFTDKDGVISQITGEPFAGPKWVVTRFDINEDGSARISSWINPSSDAIPTDESAAFVSDLAVSDISGFSVEASEQGVVTLHVDEFRMGYTFRDVSTRFGSDDPNLLAYEPFNYDAGVELVGTGGINAFWDGIWDNFDPLEDNVQTIGNGSLQLEGVGEPVGNKARIEYLTPSSSVHIDRPLAFPMKDDGRTYWLTFLMFTEETPTVNNVGNITLRNSDVENKQGQMLAFGRIYGTGNLGAITPQNNNPFAIEDKPDIGLNWVVAKMVTGGNEEPDSIYMWVNPDPTVEPDTSTADHFRRTPYLNDGIDVIRLKLAGAAADQVPYNVEFDEIRLATAWQSATLTTNTIDIVQNDPLQIRAYPNPAQDYITLEYELESKRNLAINLHDQSGQIVKVLQSGVQRKGSHRTTIDINNLTNGFYYLSFVANGEINTRKLIIFK